MDSEKRLTAVEVRKLPEAERNRVLEQAAAAIEAAYGERGDLRGFDAFGEEDLFDASLPEDAAP